MDRPVRACIGLGANLGDAQGNVLQAIEALRSVPGVLSVQPSRLYRTPAWGRVDQPDFINACACFQTTLSPLALLDALQAIENAHGRVRLPGQHWGPRTLDLDLLLYGDAVIDDPRLTVPHPWMHQRAFVLVPLSEIAPEAVIAGIGTVTEALARIETGEVRPIGG